MASNIVKYLKLDAEKTLGGLHDVGRTAHRAVD